MCGTNYPPEVRKLFDRLSEVAGHILEGMDVDAAAATQNMTGAEFKKALKTDIRKINFEAYLKISEAMLDKEDYLLLLEEEFWPCKLEKYVELALNVLSEKEFKQHLESNIRFKNYAVYSKIASMQGYNKLAP